MTYQKDYQEAIDWLYDLQYFGTKLGLDNTLALLAELGNPHERLRAVHVAGTNGKGSVCAFLTGILMDAGLKVGTYTSPHLRDFGERVCIDNYPMTRAEVLRAIGNIRPAVEKLASRGVQCTFFETTTCMAFRHFAGRRVDVAVAEVGMGGRLDSTNVLNPALSVITNISLEHKQHLGDTLEKIAREKAGIIKKGVPAVSGVAEPAARNVMCARASEMGAVLRHAATECEVTVNSAGLLGSDVTIHTKNDKYNNIKIKLSGAHQANNSAISVVAAEVLGRGILPVSKWNIIRGMERARWPARLQVVRKRPTVILDATHNPGGADTLAAFLETHYRKSPPVLVLGMLEDKEAGPVVRLLEPLVSKTVVTQSTYHRRMAAGELASFFTREPEVEISVGPAIARAMNIAGREGTVLITGSLFTAADAIECLDTMRLREMTEILSGLHGMGAYPGRDPKAPGEPPPDSREPFRVLISTILSQRTKDENTHVATQALFAAYDTPGELASARQEDVEALIRPAGFYKQKARNIIMTATALRDRFGSKVPDSMGELVSLPGVGRKTANCVLAYGFGIPAIAVDTHVHRISNLMGLVRTREPDDTEDSLMRTVPKDLWMDMNRLIVRHGQTICVPVKPRCEKCPVSHLCDFGIYSG